MMNDEKCQKNATSLTVGKKGVTQSDQSTKQGHPNVKQRDPSIKQHNESLKQRDPSVKPRDPSIKQHTESLKHRDRGTKLRVGFVKQPEESIKHRTEDIRLSKSILKQRGETVKQCEQAVDESKENTRQSTETVKSSEKDTQESDTAIKQCEEEKLSNDVTRKTFITPVRSKFRYLARLMTTKKHERVLYPRQAKLVPGSRVAVVGGTPITMELAMELRQIAFGTASCGARGEWTRTALVVRAPCSPLAYGLAAARNAARSLLAALQAHILQWLLFGDNEGRERGPAESYLRPDAERQQEALWRAVSEAIWRCGAGERAIVALPQDTSYIPHSTQYYQDGVTEKLHLYDFTNLEDLQIFIKRYLHVFQEEPGPGAMLVLYAAILSRGCENIKKDLDGKLNYLVSNQVEGSINVVTLLLTGRATSYLHNGVIYVGDEDHYALPQFGILARSRVGFLIWYGNEDGTKNETRQQPGSRLKTPAFPIWVTSCAGHFGVLFNTNRELLRNYHAERRFDIHYYTCGGCYVLLTVDTRSQDDDVPSRDDIHATPLERLIHTKWQDAKVTWTGPTPYVGEQSNH